MAIGTTAAIVSGLIAAGGNVAGAAIKSKAEKNAAKTQRTAANLAAQRQERTTQDVLRRLDASRRGLPNAPPPMSPYPPAGGSLDAINQLGSGAGMGQENAARPSGMSPGFPGGPVNRAPLSLGAAGGGMVMLEGPDGSRKSVPAQMAQRYVSRGAKVIQ